MSLLYVQRYRLITENEKKYYTLKGKSRQNNRIFSLIITLGV